MSDFDDVVVTPLFTDYTKSVGTAGTMAIRDNGTVVEFYIACSDGATNVGSYTWSGTINGSSVGGTVSLPAGFGIKVLGSWSVTTTQTVSWHQNATGTQGLGGAADVSASINRTPVNQVPPAPNIRCFSPNPDQITASSMRVRFCSTGSGSSPIIRWDLRYGTNSATLDTTGTTIVSTGTSVVTGLAAGTTYYFKARGVNAVGAGPWSATVSAATIPSPAPTLVVNPSAAGTSAVLTFTPPGGVSGVTKYVWERRVRGTTAPVASGESLGITTTVAELVPGETYDWRASAWVGTAYQSPWTAWQAATQPRPTLKPGDYFDGATPDTPNIDYGWTGTANVSISTASAKVPAGWQAVFGGGASGVLFQVLGGIAANKAAQVTFFTDATAAGGVSVGMASGTGFPAQVASSGSYVGSIHVNPSRAQNMQATISWLLNDGSTISTDAGAAVLAPAGVFTRLSVTATAPADAVLAVVRATDVAGTGWVAWKGSEYVVLDGAMVTLSQLYPYFDGDTPDTIDYDYVWVGSPNASPSSRTTVTSSSPPSGLFECDPPPAPPRPPTIPNECIDDSGVWRRLWVGIPAAEISNWIASLPTITLTTGGTSVGQTRIRVYENPDLLPAELIDQAKWVSEQIVIRIPADTELIVDGVDQRAWASVAGSPLIPADSLLYGTGGTPATWPVLKCGIDYWMTFDTPLEGPVGAVQPTLELTRRL